MHVVAPSARPGLNVRLVMREAQYPLRTLAVRDQDGNPILITDEAGLARPLLVFDDKDIDKTASRFELQAMTLLLNGHRPTHWTGRRC